MKTATFNKRHILYGMLIVTLGFSKSWFHTADYAYTGSKDLAVMSDRDPANVIVDPTQSTLKTEKSKPYALSSDPRLHGLKNEKTHDPLLTLTKDLSLSSSEPKSEKTKAPQPAA